MRPGSSACSLPIVGVSRKADKSSIVVLSARATVSHCHSVTGRDTCDTCDSCDSCDRREKAARWFEVIGLLVWGH